MTQSKEMTPEGNGSSLFWLVFSFLTFAKILKNMHQVWNISYCRVSLFFFHSGYWLKMKSAKISLGMGVSGKMLTWCIAYIYTSALAKPVLLRGCVTSTRFVDYFYEIPIKRRKEKKRGIKKKAKEESVGRSCGTKWNSARARFGNVIPIRLSDLL